MWKRCFLVLAMAATHAAIGAPARSLSVRDAINEALHNNVNVLMAAAGRVEAAGQQAEARAALLPHLSAGISQSRQQINLAAQGISFPGVPPTVTYNNFQARLQLQQKLIDLSAWQSYKSAKAARAAAVARQAVALEQIAAETALDYVEDLRAQQAVDAAQADLELAYSLAKLAVDQHDAGVASGVDVARANTSLSQRRVRLAQARTGLAQAQIRLARVTGLPQSQPLLLNTSLELAPSTTLDTDTAIHDAFGQRPELRLANARVKSGRHQLSAARNARLPSLGVTGAYGDTGSTPHEHNEETYRVEASLEMPIFSGGAISGRINAAASRVDQAQLQVRDTREQIEQDVRLALRTLDTNAEQVAAARDSRNLAQRELKLSRDRFAAGVSNNIEVIDAQTSLANARNGLVSALAQYASARVNLAAALGQAQGIDF